jgi:propanol-preferring alcohol dehydrogenase
VRNAKREPAISLLIECNASGDAEQIRKTVNTGRLHARVEHNPNFVGGARRCCSSLMALTKNCRVSLSRSIHRQPSLSATLAETSGIAIMSLAAKTLTLAAIVKCRWAEDLTKSRGQRHPCSTDGELMMEAASTYRAVHAVSLGRLELTEKTMQAPGPGRVRIRVEACGVCHSDSGTVEGLFPIDWPRVPGHEVVGRIDALGSGVQGWVVGQRVGVGFLGASCGYCEFCRSGDLVNCRNQEYAGIHHDGGYAEVMIAKASGLVSIPDDLSSVGAAPLLCAGLTTFSALRNAPAKAGDLVAVLGIGGLGHLGVQYARHMGFEVAAIARGADKAELARKLGAHHYIDNAATNPAEALQALGGAKVVLITASGGKTVSETFKGLRPGGVSIVLGVGPEPIEVSSMDLIFGSRKLEGALTGDPATGEETLRFSALSGVSAMIETVPLEEAADAYAKMMAGKARFRMVLTMD